MKGDGGGVALNNKLADSIRSNQSIKINQIRTETMVGLQHAPFLVCKDDCEHVVYAQHTKAHQHFQIWIKCVLSPVLLMSNKRRKFDRKRQKK
jgi:hypothetical protein